MARRALILVFLVTMTGGCPDLTRSERRPQHRSGDDTVAPAAPVVAAEPGDDGVDEPARPAARPGARGPAAPNPLKVRPGLRPDRPVPRQPLRARPVPGGLPARPVPGRPAPDRRPPPSDVAPDGTVH